MELTLANSAEEIFINLVQRWADEARDVKALFSLGLADEVVRNLLAVLGHSAHSVLDKIGVEDLGTTGIGLD